MITEDYVSFGTAKFLKYKGFNVACDYLYVDGKLVRASGFAYNWNDGETLFTEYENECSAPTLQMAMKWLREVHNIVICICAYYPANPYELNYRNNKPYWKIRIMNHVFSIDYDSFNTYEEACGVAIKYCLENLI